MTVLLANPASRSKEPTGPGLGTGAAKTSLQHPVTRCIANLRQEPSPHGARLSHRRLVLDAFSACACLLAFWRHAPPGPPVCYTQASHLVSIGQTAMCAPKSYPCLDGHLTHRFPRYTPCNHRACITSGTTPTVEKVHAAAQLGHIPGCNKIPPFDGLPFASTPEIPAMTPGGSAPACN